MNTARQILRFSIPGSIFLLNAVGCYLIYRRIQGVPFVTASTPIRENGAALIAAIATIPVGFVVYQIYYFTYEPVLRIRPLSWGGRFVRKDRGGQILKTLDPTQIATLEDILGCSIDLNEPHSIVESDGSVLGRIMHRSGVLEIAGAYKTLTMESGERRLAYENLWHTHWNVLRSTVDIAGSYPGSKQVKSEYTTLSDIYHSLGAARTAVLSSWISVSVLSISHIGRVWSNPVAALGGFIAISGIAVAMYLVFHIARGRTWQTAAASLTYGLRWLDWRHGHELRRPQEDPPIGNS